MNDKEPKMTEEPDEMTQPKAISQSTPLTLSLVIGLVGALLSFTWFIARLQADVRTMQTDVAGIKVAIQDFSKIEKLQTEIREIRQFGSDVSRKTALDYIELKRDFELYKVQHVPPTK